MKGNLYARRVLLALVPLLTSSTALALANRVFVSARSGNNANSCDNINTPCQTFAGAVAQLNPGGEAIVLDSGGYGAVTITQAVTIEAPAGVAAFIHPATGDAITVNAGLSDMVTLRGLTLNGGPGYGITVNSGGTLIIEDSFITGFTQIGIHMGVPGALQVRGVDVKGCGTGIQIDPQSGTASATMDRCRLDSNGAGFVSHAMYIAVVNTTATNCSASGNTGDGWYSNGTYFNPGTNLINLEFCTAAENGGNGVKNSNGPGVSTLRLSNCVVTNNGGYGIQSNGNGVLSRGNNTIDGNVTGDVG